MRGPLVGLALAVAVLGLTGPEAGAAWRQSAFVVGGYLVGGDPPSLIRLNDAGITLAIPSDNSAPPRAREVAARFDSLRLHHPGFRMQEIACEETSPPRTLAKNPDPAANRAALLAEFGPAGGLNNASVVGWYLWDEPPIYYPPKRSLPPGKVFDSIHEMTRLIRDPANGAGTRDKLAFVNLFPIQIYPWFGTPCSADTVAAYGCYLDQYLSRFDGDSLPAPVLSFDNYPFEVPRPVFRRYFVQLATVRDRAARYSRPGYAIPFWSVIQASPRREKGASPYYPTPTFNQIRWQAYVSIAYGAKGILYWTLRPMAGPPSEPGFGASFLQRDGSPNGALYDSLTALNAELRGLGPTLMSLDPVAVFHAAANRFVLPRGDDSLTSANSPLQLVSALRGVTNQGLAGSFRARAGGDGYILIANKDTLVAQSFRVTLRSGPRAIERVRKTDGGLVPVASNASAFDTGIIAPGGGELFRLGPPR
ncbi:MAG TPA: hypothetical protein VI792_07090 [Candidatus Eisenbacteria bacterium]